MGENFDNLLVPVHPNLSIGRHVTCVFNEKNKQMKKILFYFWIMFIQISCISSSYAKDSHKKDSKISIGIITPCNNPDVDLKKVNELGFSHCQLSIASYSQELANELKNAIKKYDIKPTALICMGPGPYKWDFVDGPSTIGLVPREYRKERIKRLHDGIDFCKEVGISAVHAHFGFIPENPKDSLYIEFVEVMKGIGKYAKEKGVNIYFETGQETPTTLVRVISDIGTGNLFINCDLANLVMYGKSNSIDGLKLMRSFVKELHAKDGVYPEPTNTYILGKEKPIPEGEVNFPAVINFLKDTNFEGTLIIENELSEKNHDYLLKTKVYLENLINN